MESLGEQLVKAGINQTDLREELRKRGFIVSDTTTSFWLTGKRPVSSKYEGVIDDILREQALKTIDGAFEVVKAKAA